MGHIIGIVVKDNLSHHHPVLAQHFRQLAGIDARNARHLFAFQPVAEAFHGIPMTVVTGIIAYDKGFGVDAFALHKYRQPVGGEGKRRHTVIARQGICKRHQLSGIRRVGQAFGIARHGSIEHHLSRYRLFITKRLAAEAAPVVKDKSHISHIQN